MALIRYSNLYILTSAHLHSVVSKNPKSNAAFVQLNLFPKDI